MYGEECEKALNKKLLNEKQVVAEKTRGNLLRSRGRNNILVNY